MTNSDDSKYMQRALQLAANGLGNVQPNPMVGAVIVHDNKIIGEGWHKKYGEPHAEVNAIKSVKDLSILSKSTMYVNLEPCSHYGKTPPCSELLCKHEFSRVVIANRDPNEKVNGKGIQQLKENGIEVTTGVLAEEGIKLNKRFFTYHLLHRPYIILKWAETENGYMDINREESPEHYWITNQELTIFSHKLRNEEQAILIGYNTYLNDHPKLTNRLFGTHQPFAFVTSKDIFRTPPTPFTVIPDQIPDLLRELYIRKIQSVIIEGGKRTLLHFFESGIWDEAIVFQGNQTWEDGLQAPEINQSQAIPISERSVCGNKVKHYLNSNPFLDPFLSVLK